MEGAILRRMSRVFVETPLAAIASALNVWTGMANSSLAIWMFEPVTVYFSNWMVGSVDAAVVVTAVCAANEVARRAKAAARGYATFNFPFVLWCMVS